MYRNKELSIKRSMLQNDPGEIDVLVKVFSPNGGVTLATGFYKEIGALCDGSSLDPDEEFAFEVARPEIELKILGFGGTVCGVEALENTVKGPRTLFRRTFDDPVTVLPDEALTVAGPAY